MGKFETEGSSFVNKDDVFFGRTHGAVTATFASEGVLPSNRLSMTFNSGAENLATCFDGEGTSCPGARITRNPWLEKNPKTELVTSFVDEDSFNREAMEQAGFELFVGRERRNSTPLSCVSSTQTKQR
jgi:hypothetical protein